MISIGIVRVAALGLFCSLVGCLTGCSLPQIAAAPTQYDLGPLSGKIADTQSLAPISMIEVQAPLSMSGQQMYYRLLYANENQARPYAQNRWNAAPALMLDLRMRRAIAAAGAAVVPADGMTALPVLRVELEDFTQNFTSPAASTAQVVLRATVYKGRGLLAQTAISRSAPAASADAAGGAAAFTVASDAAIADMVNWLAGLPLKK